MTQEKMEEGIRLRSGISTVEETIKKIERMENKEVISIMCGGAQTTTEVKIQGNLKLRVLDLLREDADFTLKELEKQFKEL